MPCAIEPPSINLHVDELILDYLLWNSTNSLLIERRQRLDPITTATQQSLSAVAQDADSALKLANQFHALFRRQHPNSSLPAPIALRLRIARFTAMFLRRLDLTAPAFETARDARRLRAEGWLRRRLDVSVVPSAKAGAFAAPHTPYAAAALTENAKALLKELGHAPNALYGSATLADAMWEFLLMSTTLSTYFEEVSNTWMDVLGDFMQQAALEEYRVHGAMETAGLDVSFSVGLTPMESVESETIEELVVNELFAGDGGEVGRVFEEIRVATLYEVGFPPLSFEH